MKVVTAICNVLFLAFGMSAAAFASAPEGAGGVRCIVIDAGHGGKDPGAVGNGQQEKAINLGVALRLGRMIGEQLPDVKVVYTRKDDRFIALADRSKIAAKAGGDLFISIHTNSSPSREATGTETYVMGEDKGNRNLSVVMRENSVISLEADYTSRYEGYDPNSSESLIIFSLMQYAYQSQSLSLAELIQTQYAGHAQRRNKGVKQAGFLVLWRTPMPSVLTELGFISNPAEAKFLGSAAGQEKLASSIFRAVKEYKRRTDSRTMASGPDVSREPVATPPVRETAVSGGKTAAAGGTSPTAGTENAGEVVFRIQVKSSLSKIPVTRSNFGDYASRVQERRIDGRYKYFCGSSFSYQEALLLQRTVRRSFPDAFMVAFRGGRPVPLADVIRK